MKSEPVNEKLSFKIEVMDKGIDLTKGADVVECCTRSLNKSYITTNS